MSWVALECDGAPRLVHNGFAYGEPQAGTARIPAARRVAARETLEDVRQESGVDAVALIFNTQLHPVLFPPQQHFDIGTWRAVLERVQEQVGAEQCAFVARERDERKLVCRQRKRDSAHLRHRLKLLGGR